MFELFDIKQNHVIEFGEFVRSLSVFHPKAPLEDKAKCEQLLCSSVAQPGGWEGVPGAAAEGSHVPGAVAMPCAACPAAFSSSCLRWRPHSKPPPAQPTSPLAYLINGCLASASA